MTSTNDNLTSMAGLTIVLKPLRSSTLQAIGLADWLSKFEPVQAWIPLVQQNGVTKVMLVAEAQDYSTLTQTICQQIIWNVAIAWQGNCYEFTGIEVDNHDLHVLQISLTPAESLPRSMGRAIHAQFSQWLAIADSALADHLHQQSQLPFTLSISPGSHPKLRISLLQKKLLAPLLLGLSHSLGQEMLLANIACRLGQAIDIVQMNQFEQLTQTIPKEAIELEFLSPTSFKQGQQIQPFPLPEFVFAGLHRRWNAFAPNHLHFPKVEWQSLVAMYELRTKTFRMEGGSEIGSVGWVRYRFPNPEQARIATILAHFASFAGVGRKTTMGMGQTRLKGKEN
ncbi:MAG: CRISPR system precrRNA processing endoribonuclease RAMP protein Cas6 [Oculatellaceae cyanobacterium bins.114]|nr:CRISPR system precrRNA processing endoribonuclease RAMP protein Cas6 [Oculatellaceae cyanobacterium bins.114]